MTRDGGSTVGGRGDAVVERGALVECGDAVVERGALVERGGRARRVAVLALAAVHVLGALGAPLAAKIHLFQAGATAHQDFHVLWEACKYFAASVLALGVALGPLARGERWAWWVMVVASAALFGGVFFADALTGGAPAIDHWAYGSFLVISIAALAVVRPGPQAAAARAPLEAQQTGLQSARSWTSTNG